MQMEKLICIHLSILYGINKHSKYGLFKGKNNKSFYRWKSWVLPKHSLGPELGGPGEPEGNQPLFAYFTAQLSVDSAPPASMPWQLELHTRLIALGGSLL